MQRDTKTCSIAGHEICKITHICTFQNCLQGSRFMCRECIRNQNHIHQAHEKFMRLEDFRIYLNSKVKAKIEQQYEQAERIPQFIKDIIQIAKELLNVAEKQRTCFSNFQEIRETYQNADKNLLTLRNEQLNKLINIEDGNVDYFQTQNDLSKPILQLQQMFKDIFTFSYSTHNVIETKSIYSPSISQNEQYLGFIDHSKCLKINKLKSNQTIMNKKFLDDMWLAKFSSDSKFLFSLDHKGKFRQIQTRNNCKLIFSRNFEIDEDDESDFTKIDNRYMAVVDGKINMYDLTKRGLIQQFGTRVNFIEFDKINNLILASEGYIGITFYERNSGNIVFKQRLDQCIEVSEIQLINRSQNLLIHDQYALKVYSINYQCKKMYLVKQFNLQFDQFQSVCQDQRIIIRNLDQILVIDYNFNLIYQNKDYEPEGSYMIGHFGELETMNYILIEENEALVILKNIYKV